ncbi:recombinase family protein [Methylobacterium oryzisoli]|uniref:recombinase family protein n=1 Tax=Methylobacterium oryzisoli TaxID=3385502 RepID=UPI003891C57D
MHTPARKGSNFLRWHAKAISTNIANGKTKAIINASSVSSLVQELRAAGSSFYAIANELEARRIPTARGGKWSVAQVKNVLRWTT